MEHGAGATHIAVALSNFLCSKRGCPTAYIELNASRQICAISGGETNSCFRFLKIDFYPEMIPNRLPDILKKHYSCVLFDMGILGSSTYPEFMRCDLKLVVGSIRPWKSRIFWNWLNNHQTLYKIHPEDIILLGNMGIKEELDLWNRQYHISIHAVPYLENPFRLTSSDWTFFERLLKEK